MKMNTITWNDLNPSEQAVLTFATENKFVRGVSRFELNFDEWPFAVTNRLHELGLLEPFISDSAPDPKYTLYAPTSAVAQLRTNVQDVKVCATCKGNGSIVIGYAEDYEGHSHAVYDDCPDCQQKDIDELAALQAENTEFMTRISELAQQKNAMSAELKQLRDALEMFAGVWDEWLLVRNQPSHQIMGFAHWYAENWLDSADERAFENARKVLEAKE